MRDTQRKHMRHLLQSHLSEKEWHGARKGLCDRATGGRTSFAANLSTAVKGAASGTLITCKTQACQARLQFMAGCSFRPDSARALCGHGACSHLVRQLGV